MGNFLGRATTSASSAAAKRVPNKFTAAPNADAYVQAAREKAAAAAAASGGFPEMPSVPSQQMPSGTRPPLSAEMEMDANRGIAEMLNKSSILTRAEPTTGSSSASSRTGGVESKSDDAAQTGGLPVSDLMAALTLHAQQPDRWTPAALARKYDIADREASLASALSHLRPYTVVEEDGRFVGVEVQVAAEEASLTSKEKVAIENERLFQEAQKAQEVTRAAELDLPPPSR